MSARADAVELTPEQLRRLQLKSLETLRYFKDFCKKNNLLFYFCGGCCIGTLRNKGFIPWDDDIDVFMPREDYEKLYELWNKKADTERFSCLKATKNRFISNIFTTIVDNNTTLIKPHQKDLDIPHGITMDVLPLDGCPSGRMSRGIQKVWALIYSLYMAQMVPQNHGKLVSLVGKIMLGLVPSRRIRYNIAKFAERQMSKYPIEDCEKITELCSGPRYMQNEYPKKAFESAVWREFEGEKMPIPTGYDDYLRIAFGDYMELPPEEKQIPHHEIIFLDLENGYKKYKGMKYCKEDKK